MGRWALNQLEFVNIEVADQEQNIIELIESNEVQTCDENNRSL